ncbi:glycosyltransferase [Candidatus Saganbacteria bacterium]|nr:glycosyltransferase [Candidatus Saganbacteria bacterium]
MKKKILYLFSDTGGGHRAGAKALMNSVELVKPNTFEQEMIDVFSELSGFLNIFAKLYSPVIKYTPQMWGMLYYFLDDEKKLQQLEQISRPFILKELTKLIKKGKPDIIVSVHPMVNHLTAQAIKDSGLKIPFVVVVMDPVTLHRAWITPDVDICIVATEDAKQLAMKYGMPQKKIKVRGMPIDPKFSKGPQDKAPLRKQDGLDPKKFTVLLMGGGEGAGGMYEIIEEIERSYLNVQLIIISGRNKKLEEKLIKKQKDCRVKMKIYGFTDQVPKIMSQSDLIITKAGPGTIAEALAMNLPIIVTSWLPGQEEGNVQFVVKNNVGRVTKDPKVVLDIIKELQAPAEYKKIQNNIKKARRPNAAIDIASDIIHSL